jgi:uncharacterized protein YkwD
MSWALIVLLVLVPGTGTPSGKSPTSPEESKTSAASSASVYSPSPMYDVEAEQQLLELANQARASVGAPALQSDDGLVQAARAHADAMAEQQRLSHQLRGEPSLPSRLAAASELHLDLAGENVAFAGDAQDAHDHLMLSPPHRENLLNPAFNVAGFGVVHSGDRIYVVEDFGHNLPVYSGDQSSHLIFTQLNQARQQASLPLLNAGDQPGLHDAVCSMALEGRLATHAMHDFAQRYTVLSYTNMHPEILPSGTNRLLADRRYSQAAVSVCYARTSAFPNGNYWVGVLLY